MAAWVGAATAVVGALEGARQRRRARSRQQRVRQARQRIAELQQERQRQGILAQGRQQDAMRRASAVSQQATQLRSSPSIGARGSIMAGTGSAIGLFDRSAELQRQAVRHGQRAARAETRGATVETIGRLSHQIWREFFQEPR